MRPDWADRLTAGIVGLSLPRYPIPDGGSRDSSVLIALSQAAAGPGVLLLERAATLRSHAGQIAFPGGASDPDDPDAVATALREAQEEVGLDPASVEILGVLPEVYIPPSRFLVTPVLAWWARPHPVSVVDTREVASVAVVPIADLAEPTHRFRVVHPSGFTGPGFAVGGWFVWGFTAGLLDRLIALGGWEQPWDETEERPLPGSVGTVQP